MKLAGTLALLWGNERFELPPLPHLSIVAGIAFHDRAYGYLDNIPVGEVDDEQWLALTRRGFYMPCADPVADLVTRQHLLRLVAWRDTPPRNALREEMRAVMKRQIEENGLDAGLLLQVDRMTDLCDRVSFDFCRESPVDKEVELVARYAANETSVVRYQISEGEIVLTPWTLRVPRCEGYLVAYRSEGYPERLEALVIPYTIRPAELQSELVPPLLR